MKNYAMLALSASLLLVLLSCNKCNSGSTENEPDTSEQINGENIGAIVRDIKTDGRLSDVVVIIESGGVDTPYDTTSSTGTCTLPNISSRNTYRFEKEGYSVQGFKFADFSNLTNLNVYLNPGTTTAVQTNLRGTVYDGSGQPADSVWVKSGQDSVLTDLNGKYSLDVPGGYSNFPLSFKKNITSAAFGIEADQDTIEVDVFIDGITIDTLKLKE